MIRGIVVVVGVAGFGLGCSSDQPNQETGGNSTNDTSAGTTNDTLKDETGATIGTEGEGSESSGPNPVCDSDIATMSTEIFVPKCSVGGCHDASTHAAGLNLAIDSAMLAERLIGQASGTCDGQALVVPGSRDLSFLYTKLMPSPACGITMPVGSPLAIHEIECIGQWIDDLLDSGPESGTDTGELCETCGGLFCIDFETDASHCGACNASCPPGISCADGICDCPENTQECASACVNMQSDPQHCGECDIACKPGAVCLAGQCMSDCGSLNECSGACVETQTDPMHCGGCNSACSAGEQCSEGQCLCSGGPISFKQEVAPILSDGCASNGCHGGKQAKDDLDLNLNRAYMELVNIASTQCSNRTLVVPGDVDNSYLFDKLLGVDMCSGTRMPKGDGPLTAGELDAISRWICNGALDN